MICASRLSRPLVCFVFLVARDRFQQDCLSCIFAFVALQSLFGQLMQPGTPSRLPTGSIISNLGGTVQADVGQPLQSMLQNPLGQQSLQYMQQFSLQRPQQQFQQQQYSLSLSSNTSPVPPLSPSHPPSLLPHLGSPRLGAADQQQQPMQLQMHMPGQQNQLQGKLQQPLVSPDQLSAVSVQQAFPGVLTDPSQRGGPLLSQQVDQHSLPLWIQDDAQHVVSDAGRHEHEQDAVSGQVSVSHAVVEQGKGEGEGEELHCLCRTPYDSERFYIQCDGCNQW